VAHGNDLAVASIGASIHGIDKDLCLKYDLGTFLAGTLGCRTIVQAAM